MTTSAPPVDRRRRGLIGQCRRVMVRWAGPILVAFAGVTGTFLFTVARGVLAAPAKVDKLAVVVDALVADIKLYRERTDSLQRGQSVTNAFKCFELPDSIFRGSLLPCGEAFIASRIDPKIWRRIKP